MEIIEATSSTDKSDARKGANPADEDGDARAFAWSILGAVLTQPATEAVLDTFRQLPDTREDATPMGLSWHALKLASRNAPDLDAIRAEYNDLFIGVGRGELVPYGSWYMTGFLMDRPLAELRKDLRNLGFERNPDVKEPEDHAGALAETMAMIITGENIAPRAQSTFFDRHISSWMQRFFQDLAGAKSAKFYRAIGQFGAQFVETEREYLSL